MLNNLFVFDIETIPDTDVLYDLTGSDTVDVIEKRKELEEYSAEVSGGNAFPRQLFHKVVSVSYLVADIESVGNFEYYKIKHVKTISSIRNSEKEIVEKFFEYLCRNIPRIVDYNGRTFDLPVMKYRAMKYGITAENFFKSGDKWNNYMYKYSSDWHCDLLDVLSDFGSSARCKMNEVCALFNLPGKIGVDGSKVASMYDDGKLKEIDDYCETDVLNTYLIYLRYMLFTGKINKKDFLNMNKDLINFLVNEKQNHFDEFLSEWEKVDKCNLFQK